MQYHRGSIRLKDYDYSDFGYYFVIICTLDHHELFGKIVVVGATLVVAHDAQNKRAGTRPAPTIKSKTLGNIIGAFKSITTHQYIKNIKTNNWPWFAGRLWQRNYYEHIIRNQKSLNRIRLYIQNNPENWETDRNNPKNFNI